MKKTLTLLLCVLLLCAFASCQSTPKTADEILKDYDLLDQSGLDTYYQVLDNLTSGEITLKYSENKNRASILFSPLENGEKKILVTVENGQNKMYNYFDGAHLFVIVNGQGTQVDPSAIEKNALYYNYLGAPQEALNQNYVTDADVYLKKDKSEYLITITTDYDVEGSTVINMYLDENKNPKYLKLFDTYFDENGKEKKQTITMTYSSLGEKVDVKSPEFELVSQ